MSDAGSLSANDTPFFLLHWADTQLGSGWFAEPAFQAVLDEVPPAFPDVPIVVTGDLIENGNSVEDWITYESMLAAAGLTSDRYMEVPGNHDSFLDGDLDNYNSYSVSGKAGMGSHWVRDLHHAGKHIRIIGVNTADAGDPLRDGAGYIKESQIDELLAQIAGTSEPDATLVLGHHPTEGPDTLEIFGTDSELERLLVETAATAYLFGHRHFYSSYWRGNTLMTQASTVGNPGSLPNTDIDEFPAFSLFAIDRTGPVVKNVPVGTESEGIDIHWPVVLITAPANPEFGVGGVIGDANPYAEPLARNSTVTVRAGAFAPSGITSVTVSACGAEPAPMEALDGYYQADIHTSAGESCTITVTAVAGDGRSDADSFEIALQP